MEKTTGGLELDVVTENTVDDAEIHETILAYSDNFIKIENELKQTVSSPDTLATGVEIPKGKIIWNSNPQIGGYVGWVNTRKGKHAQLWKPDKIYVLGEEVTANPNNGNIYRCTVAGRSMMNNPSWQYGTGVEFYDASGNSWMKSFVYKVGDVVFSTNGSKLFYYICVTAGLSSNIEPSWSAALSGTTIVDGSVVWRKEPTVRWKQVGVSAEFRPFGKVE